MAHTVELLALIDEYPEAFVEPTEHKAQPASTPTDQSSESSALMSLIAEFPDAFAEPEELPKSASNGHASNGQASDSRVSKDENSASSQDALGLESFDVPAGYEMALHQTIASFGWGKIEAYLRYDDQALSSLWIVVGKSGTEVQSFCEAIARLTNKLLAVGTPISDIVRELRGIRGGDSEGLGPHRFLGLVDLFGKILQEAPSSLAVAPATATASTASVSPQTESIQMVSSSELEAVATPQPATEPTPSSNGHQWLELSDSSSMASICPECGAELQQVNGCSGGACVVCGYSSCS